MINNGKKDMMFGKPKKKKKLNLCTKYTTIEQKFLNKKVIYFLLIEEKKL